MYSTGIWSDEEGGVRGDIGSPTHGLDKALESAQQRKLHHVCKALRLFPGARLLEFGSGWGGLAIEVRFRAQANVLSDDTYVIGRSDIWL